MSSAYERELETALAAVRTAAVVCQAVQSQITPDVLEKKDRSPVTVADFSSQALVCRELQAAFPDDPVIGEEDSAELRTNAEFLERVTAELATLTDSATPEAICNWIDRGGSSEFSDRFWTLDPIDGTKGFIRGQQYAISLALIVNGQIEVAVLGCPNLPIDANSEEPTGALLSAVRGQGATIRPLEDDQAEPQTIQVSRTGETNLARFCESVEAGHSSHGHSQQVAERLNITAEPARLDSQAKYAVVSRGEADIYMRLPTRADYREKIWDHAGGVLILEEAGGKVTDVTGKPLEMTHGREMKNNRGVIVTNGLLHDAVIESLTAVGVC
jgi:3'(2'), 5'-bisphosphate nucleotidase